MHRRTVLFLAIIVALAFTAPTLHAQENCDTACTSTTSCDTTCWTCQPEQPDPTYCPQNDTHYMTCGDYTTSCATCTPNWVRTDRTKIGGGTDSVFCIQSLCWCHIESYYIATYHDANNCGQADYTKCETDGVTFFGGTDIQDPDECCHYTDPADISHSDYCGGSIC